MTASTVSSSPVPIRVLHLGSPTGLYGAERWILALVKHLDPTEVHSTVAVVRDDPALEAPLCRESEKLGIPSRAFEVYGKANPAAVREVREFIRRNHIDIIHTHWYKADLIGVLATLGLPCKTISTPHGWSKHADFKTACYEAMNRCIFSFMDAVVPLSRDLLKELEHGLRLNGKLCFVENAVDVDEIESHKGIAREILEWKKEGSFIIGYIGQLIPRKGLDALLKAVSRIKEIDWKLAIVGDGESRSRLEGLANELDVAKQVRFFGFREDRLSFLKGFDLFVLPSLTEGIPRCVMEAMAAGAPVAATNIPGVRDLIRDRQTGLLFEVNDEAQLAKQIVQVALDPELSRTLTSNAKDLIYGQFSAANMARRYTAIYAALCRSQNGPINASSTAESAIKHPTMDSFRDISANAMRRHTVSIVIPAFNEEQRLPACLKSIQDIRCDKGLIEVIVVDNGSTDRTREIARSYGARVIRDDEKNVSGLRNLGVEEASGDIIAFIDADCTVSKDWLERASVYFDREELAAWGSPPIIPKDATWVQKTWFVVRQRDAELQEVDWLESMNLFIAKTKFNEIGGFNESLVTCEDVDFSYRIKSQGIILSDSRIKTVHFGEASTIKEFIRKEIWRGRGNLHGILSHGVKMKELPSLAVPVYFGLLMPALFLAALIACSPALAVVASLLLLLPPVLAAFKVRHKVAGAQQLLQLVLLLQVYFLCRTIAAFKGEEPHSNESQ